MSYPSSPHLPTASIAFDNNSKSPTLLTPPATPLIERDTPYRPAHSNRASLTMKRKKHYHDKQTQEPRRIKSSAAMVAGSESHVADSRSLVERMKLGRSKSLALIHIISWNDTTLPGQTQVHEVTSSKRSSTARARRWTLLSKSAATRGVTPLRSTVKQATVTDTAESPAMITLRRATTNRSMKKSELTFFPEPTFGSRKTGLLTYLVSTLTGIDNHDRDDNSANFASKVENTRNTWTNGGGVHPIVTFPAATVRTEITVEPDLAMPGFMTSKPALRRCSTKYISEGSTYEIIWDENDTAASSRGSSRPSVPTERYDRRPSLAVMKLEAQLSCDASRRHSTWSSASSPKSADSEEMFLDRGITPDKLDRILPRLLHKSSLRNLPRSRGKGQVKPPSNGTLSGNVPQWEVFQNDRKSSMHSIEFFPPLSSRNPTFTTAESVETKGRRASTASRSPPSPRRLRAGSLVGASSHTRRRSLASAEQKRRRSRAVAWKGKDKKRDSLAEEWVGNRDMEPLLDKSTWW